MSFDFPAPPRRRRGLSALWQAAPSTVRIAAVCTLAFLLPQIGVLLLPSTTEYVFHASGKTGRW